MVSLFDLWLPIIVSSVAIFVGSFLAWMVLPHHRSDWQKVPDENAFSESIKSLGLTEDGFYMFPHCGSPQDHKSEEFQKRMQDGPRGLLLVWGAPPKMGSMMLFTFLFYAATSIVVGYVGTLAVDPGDGFKEVFRATSTAALLGYCFALMPNAIWFRRKCSAVVNDLVDGIVYALITGAIFGWLWPATEAALGG